MPTPYEDPRGERAGKVIVLLLQYTGGNLFFSKNASHFFKRKQ
jgi:hypothetical protein